MGETRAQSVARDFQAREVRAHAGDWVLSGVGALGLLAVWALLAWVFGWVLRTNARHKGTWTVRNVLAGCVSALVCGGFVGALGALILGLGVGEVLNVYEWILIGVLVGVVIVGGGDCWGAHVAGADCRGGSNETLVQCGGNCGVDGAGNGWRDVG